MSHDPSAYFMKVDWENLKDDLADYAGTNLKEVAQRINVPYLALNDFLLGKKPLLSMSAVLLVIAAMSREVSRYVTFDTGLLDASAPQSPPENSAEQPDINALVRIDLMARAMKGEQTYGTRLKPFNGRNALVDAYQEAMDLSVYLRQAIAEQELSQKDERQELTFVEYHEEAMSTAIYPQRGKNPYYPVLGLAGEAGEVAEKFKKIIRDKAGDWTEADRNEIAKELGDALWYITAVADEFDMNLTDIAARNLDKLKGRSKRNTLGGSGDDR